MTTLFSKLAPRLVAPNISLSWSLQAIVKDLSRKLVGCGKLTFRDSFISCRMTLGVGLDEKYLPISISTAKLNVHRVASRSHPIAFPEKSQPTKEFY
jgi:hypothetical protein